MIRLVIRGGLGNQMFQYAVALALAKKQGKQLLIDTVFLEEKLPFLKNRTYRKYGLGVFLLDPDSKLSVLSQAARRFSIPYLWLSLNACLLTFSRILGLRMIRQHGDDFDPSLTSQKGDLLLFGYWTSETYFKQIQSAVRSSFTFRRPLDGEAADVARQISDCNSVSVHVRRGDYVSLKAVQQYMAQTSLSFYADAIQRIRELSGNAGGDALTAFVFSDDVAWCQQNLSLGIPTVYVSDRISGPDGSDHMRLMSLCRNNIIANSTFSWWGAWLNENPEKIVIAPKQWLLAGNDDHIVPAEWIRL